MLHLKLIRDTDLLLLYIHLEIETMGPASMASSTFLIDLTKNSVQVGRYLDVAQVLESGNEQPLPDT